ncbi:pitrilysin family protein [Pelagibius sp. Alg239-R121]|uniref:M16 family metallopeptidase n=1 Tax=Pelagibius sp. Alg239-R121 TaxID=2993448 RepID=UPI0024A7800F|nr:pitrilysin family protein [Pelagibius sp. Alg239-R121]
MHLFSRTTSLRFLSNLHILALAAIVFGGSAWFQATADASVFDSETFTLDNGMQVVVVPNHRAPIVTHMVWYKVGAADESAGESGNAHFLEHLMFKGTKTLGPGEFSRIIQLNGGRENAFTSQDYTAYFQTVASDRLETMMKHEADRMTNLVLTDEVVLPERDVVVEERRSRTDNNPSAKLFETMRAALYLNHPYRLPVIGWQHEIKALNTKTALAFYRKWYAPNNAILIVAGDVTAAEVRPLAEKYYGVIPAKPVPERIRIEEPPQTSARRVIHKSARVRQPTLAINYLAPSYRRGATEHAYALQVLDEVLSGGSTSRLYKTLVVEKKLAVSVGSNYSASSLDLTDFSFYASPQPGVEVETLEAAVRAEIAKVLENGITPKELASAKRRKRAGSVYVRDDLGTAPRIIGMSLATGRTIEEIENWPDLIDKVTVEQVLAAARAVFRDESSVTGLLLPKPTS